MAFPARPRFPATGAVLLLWPALLAAQEASPLLPAGVPSGLPLVQANDNTAPAGSTVDGVRTVALVVAEADWRLESEAGPGLRVTAIGEDGGAPRIPAPLLRVEEGTRLRVSVRNDRPVGIAVFGLHAHPVESPDSLLVAPGETRTVEFEAGAPGTYLYSVREGPPPPAPQDPSAPPADPEREQLAGAFVVDPVGGSPPDRVMVINIFSSPLDPADPEGDWVEGLAINGRSWPYTDRLDLSVGEIERWRVVNASIRNHPMHLHGFYFEVQARGTSGADTVYAAPDRRMAVTESMDGRTTMLMEWTPTRPGRWIFHCHLSFHVSAGIRLPGAVEADPEHAHSHMAGLAVGLDVAPGPSDLVSEGPPLELDLFAVEHGEGQGYRFGFAFEEAPVRDSLTEAPGPMIVLHQYQPADVTVHNVMSVPTGVHWHGLELDAWADGVPGWSASDGRMSPVIAPGERFTYRLSTLRPGTFIYHSHLNDVVQLTGGLYGALIVLPPGESFDPRTDHVYVWGWSTPDAGSMADMDLNGRRDQPDVEIRVGERHRFRFINIAPAGLLSAWMTRDGAPVPVTLLAKDGADLPEHQRVPVESLAPFGVGETADFTWTPTEPGVYELRVGYAPVPDAHLVQRWIVRD